MSYKRRHRNPDAAEGRIVAALIASGASVERIDVIDLMVGFRKQNFLLEVKTPGYEKAHKVRLKKQAEWREAWKGQSAVVTTELEALRAIGAA